MGSEMGNEMEKGMENNIGCDDDRVEMGMENESSGDVDGGEGSRGRDE